MFTIGQGKQVVELGGGCGLAGIAIAHSCGAFVTITGGRRVYIASIPESPETCFMFGFLFNFFADTPEVCINILSNVESNAELQRRGPTEHVVEDDCVSTSAIDSVSKTNVFRASYGSIQVVPLTWGDDVPAFLNVTFPLRPHFVPVYFLFFLLFFTVCLVHSQSHPRKRLRFQRVTCGPVPRCCQTCFGRQGHCNCRE